VCQVYVVGVRVRVCLVCSVSVSVVCAQVLEGPGPPSRMQHTDRLEDVLGVARACLSFTMHVQCDPECPSFVWSHLLTFYLTEDAFHPSLDSSVLQPPPPKLLLPLQCHAAHGNGGRWGNRCAPHCASLQVAHHPDRTDETEVSLAFFNLEKAS